MATIIHDAELEQRLQSERAARGADRFDEVWEGVYVMAPTPNDEHQMIVNGFAAILQDVIGWPGLGQVRPGVNVSDRVDEWQQNYRIPHVAVFLNTTQAVNHSAFWLGGPDLAIEIVSPGDQTREKLDFYASVATRELLIVDRNPWQLELYRLSDAGMRMVSSATVESGVPVRCETVSLNCLLIKGQHQPRIQVFHPESARHWKI